MDELIFRFAPSPNGRLHLGHAYSALLNDALARQTGGRLLVRIEDIDIGRANPAHERAIIEDLTWMGIEFEPNPRRQSDHLEDYRKALDALRDEGLIYPAFMSRGDIRDYVAEFESTGETWPRDPDGAPLYPGKDKELSDAERRRRISDGAPYALRLDIASALERAGAALRWQETGMGPDGESGDIRAEPSRWGDVVLARRDAPASYHLAVVVDDALQRISNIVRGRDLFHATAIHRLLQELLGLPVPQYHHHRLVLGEDGQKLSKSRRDTAIGALRDMGATPADIARLAGFEVKCV